MNANRVKLSLSSRHLFIAGVMLAALNACGGHGTSTTELPSTPQTIGQNAPRTPAMRAPSPAPSGIYTPLPADVEVRRARMPEPFDPETSLSRLGTTSLPNTALQSAIIAQRHMLRTFATAPQNDHESEGAFIFGSAPPYNAIFGLHTAYEASQAPLPYPAGASGPENIFAPTLHPAWGSCLENSTYYITQSSANQVANFTVFNFCEPPDSATFIYSTPIDRRFLEEYVRLGPGNLPTYATEIFTPDIVPSANSTWYSLLWNFRRHRYDRMISASANGSFQADAFGWSIVEPYPAAGPCPRLAPIMASSLSVYNVGTQRWDALAPQLAGGAYTFISVEGGSANNCLLGDSTGPASINFTLLQANSAWMTTSPRM